MRIESMDASSQVRVVKPQGVSGPIEGEISTEINGKKLEVLESKSLATLTEQDKKQLSISEKVLIDAIEKANKAIVGTYTSFEFSIHEKTREIMVKVIDRDTKEVIREIPPEKVLDMVAKMWEMAGIFVDERR